MSVDASSHNYTNMNFIFSQFVAAKNSAVFLQKIEAKPAALLVQSRIQQKSFLFLLEKIGRAQNEKSKEYFSVVRRALGSGGGAASFVGGFPKMRSDFVQGVELDMTDPP